MKTKTLAACIILLCIASSLWAQESNHGKELWATSLLNKTAPKLVVEKWVGQTPDTKGKFVILDFWATWCPPCRKFIPILNDISEKHKDDLVVIGITDESVEKIDSLTGVKPNYYDAIDTKKTMSKHLKIAGIPHVILIDPKGKVRWEGFPLLPGHELTDSIVTSLITRYK